MREFEFFAQGVFELVANVLVFLEEGASVLAALAHALAGVAEPRAAFLATAFCGAEIEEIAFAGNAFAVKDVEFSFAEGRSDFVLHDFGAGARADDTVAFLDGLDAANVHAHGGVELKRAAAGGGLRIAEHHADLFANLVDEYQTGARFRNDGRELAQRLRHEARLKAHLRVAHFAFELGLGDEGRDGVHDDDVDAAGADQRLGNFEGLLAVIGLRDEKIVYVHTEFARIDRIERVLRINEGGLAAELLRFGDDVKSHGGLAAGFRAVDFDHAAAGEATNTQSGVNGETPAGNYTDGHQNVPAAQAHDRAFAVGLFDLGDRCFE